MKSNLLMLITIEIKKFFSGFNSKGRKARQTPILYVGLLILFLSILMSAGYSFLVIFPFKNQGISPSVAVSLFAGIAALLIFMTTMSQARSIYIGDDYDLLTVLPIRKRDIVISKISTMYGIELTFSMVIMIPHGIIHIIMGSDISLFFYSLLLAFTLPIVPIAIALLLSLLVTMGTAKFKYGNIISTILYAFIIVGFSAVSMIIGNMRDDSMAIDTFSNIGNVIKWVNPSFFFVELALFNNNLYILAYIGVNLVTAVGSVLFVALLFDKLHDIVTSTSMKKDYVRKDLKSKGEGKILLSLEFKRLINSKLYFVNTIMGSIMAILGSLVFIFSFTTPMKTASAEAAAQMKALFIPIYIAVVCLIFGISSPTTGVINIEGKNFWLTKSLPTDYKKLLRAKLLFSWILTIPFALIISTVAVIFIHETVWDIVFAYIIPILYIVLLSLLALIIAIHHPKLKWNSETEAVKNSASVVISMFMGLGLSSFTGAGVIVVPIVIPQYTYLAYIGVAVSLLIPIIPCYLYLNKYFGKRIDLIEDF